MKTLCCLLLLVFVSSGSFSQSDTSGQWMVSVAPNFGFVIPHRESMKGLITGHAFGVECALWKPTHGRKSWETDYQFPRHGWDFFFTNTGNLQQLGYQMGTAYLLDLPLNSRKGNLLPQTKKLPPSNSLTLGIGAGYATKKWDLRENHQADVIGSHINIALILQYRVKCIETKHLMLNWGIRITHFSNGSFQLPNLGTNTATTFLDITYRKNKPQIFPQATFSEPVKRWSTTIATAIAFKEIPPPNGRKYPASVVTSILEKRFSRKSSIGLAADWFYNTSISKLLDQKGNIPGNFNNTWQGGLGFVYTLHFNQFELKMQQGFYLRDHYKSDGALYHRFGLRYRISDHWFVQLMLKTHYAKADFGEVGFAYRIWK